MKKIIQTVAVLVSFVFADVIQMRNGQEIKDATVIKISDTDVEYKVSGKQVVYSTKKSDIANISYPNGTKDIFGSVISSAEPVNSTSSGESKTRGFGRAEFGMAFASINGGKQSGKFEPISGYRFAHGVGLMLPLSSSVFLSQQIALFYRTYGYRIDDTQGGASVKTEIAVDEWGLSAPLLAHIVLNQQFYIEAGLQMEYPMPCRVITERGAADKVEEECQGRELLDIGVAIGGGMLLIEQYALDIKGVINLGDTFSAPHGKGPSGKVYQFNIGVSYLF